MATEKHLVDQNDTIGAAPSGFSAHNTSSSREPAIFEVVEHEGKRVIEFQASASDQSDWGSVIPDSLLSVADSNGAATEVIVRVRFVESFANGFGIPSGAALHINEGISLRGYTAGLRRLDTSDPNFNLHSITAGSDETSLGSHQPFDPGNGWYFVSIKRSGTTVEAVGWPESESRPSTPMVSDTNTTWEDRTAWGHASRSSRVQISGMSIGTEDDPAPLPVEDTPGPSLTNATATLDGADGYTASVDTDTDAGTLYWLAVLDSDPDPTVADVKAGNDQAVTETGTQNVSGGPLADGTYRIWFVHEEGGEDSSLVSTGTFTVDTATGTLDWTTNPAIDTVTTDSISVTATPNEDCNVHAVAVPAGDPTPSAQQVVDGQASDGTAADAAATEAATADTQVTLNLTSLTAHPSYDVHTVADQPE